MGINYNTSSLWWGVIITCLSCQLTHKYKRGVLYESRIVFDDEWCCWITCCRCSLCSIGRDVIISSEFLKIILYSICWCTTLCISRTTIKSCSTNRIITHNTSKNVELIVSFSFDIATVPTKYRSIGNEWCSNIFYVGANINISTTTIWFFERN